MNPAILVLLLAASVGGGTGESPASADPEATATDLLHRLAELEREGPLADPDAIASVLAGCRQLADASCEARALLAEAEVFYEGGPTPASGRPAARAAELLRPAGPSADLARGTFLSRGFLADGSRLSKEEIAEQRAGAIAMARSLGAHEVEGRALCVQVGDDSIARRFDDAARHLERLDALRNEHHLPRVDACATYQRGARLFYMGQHAEARDLWASFVDSEAARAAPRERLWILIGLGAATVGGPEAFDWLGRALDLGEALGGEGDQMGVACNLASAMVSRRLTDEAERPARLCRDLARKLRKRGFESLGLNVLGRLAYQRGRLAEAEATLRKAVAAARETGNPFLLSWPLISLGNLLIDRGRHAEAEPVLVEALEVSDRTGAAEIRSGARHTLSELHAELGRFDEAERLAVESVEILGPESRPGARGFSMRALGRARLGQMRYSEALADFREQVRLFEAAENPREQANATIDLANAHHILYRLDRAAELYERAIELARQDGALEPERVARGNLLALRLRAEVRDEDLAFLRDAVETALLEGRRTAAAGTLRALAHALVEAGDVEAAETAARRALELAVAAGSRGTEMKAGLALAFVLSLDDRHPEALAQCADLEGLTMHAHGLDTMGVRWTCGQVLLRAGRAAEAVESLRQAVHMAEGARGRLDQPELKSSFLGDRTSMYVALALALLEAAGPDDRAGAVEEAFAVAEQSRARVLLEAMSLTSTVGAESTPRAGDGARADLLAEMARLHMRALAASEDEGPEILAEIRRVEDRLGEQGGAVAGDALVGTTPLDVEALRRALPVGTVAVEYFLGHANDGGSLAFIVERDRVRAERLPLDRVAFWTEARRFRRLLERRGTRADWDEEAIRAQGEKLFAALLGPLAQRLGGEVRRLVVVPDRPLYGIPFEALTIPAGPGRERARYVVEDVEVVSTPSLSLWAQLRERPPAVTDEAPFVGFANPRSPEAAIGANRPGRRTEVYPVGLPPLPYSEEEVRRAGRHLGDASVVHTGEAVTEAAVRGALGAGHPVVHLATHGFLDASSIGRSGVVLTPDPEAGDDGLLQGREIVDLRVRAGLVVLSGCSTARGGGRMTGTEGVLGLPHALFQAGVSSVVMSLWGVRDRAATIFMDRFYTGLGEGLTPSEALREAKLDLLRSGEPELAHPSVWAPFVLAGIGDPGLDVGRASRGPAAAAVLLLLGLTAVLWRLSRRARRPRSRSAPTLPDRA